MFTLCACCGQPSDQPGDMCRSCDSQVVNVETPMWKILGTDPPGYDDDYLHDHAAKMVICPKGHTGETEIDHFFYCHACDRDYPWRDLLSDNEIRLRGAYVDCSDRHSIYRYGDHFYELCDVGEDNEDGLFRKLKPGDDVQVGNPENGTGSRWKVPIVPDLRICKKCGCYIDLSLSMFAPGEFTGRPGTKDQPRAAGDFDDKCAQCWY